MPNLLSALDGPDTGHPPPLRQVRFGVEPAMVCLFTVDMEEAKLHYEGDEAVKSYLPCPGAGCPLCFLGSAPLDFYLLPVLNLESRQVEVLRISTKRGPETLAGALKQHLKNSDFTNKAFLLSRQSNRFSVEARPLAADADRCVETIAAFTAQHEQGLTLLSAFPQLSPAEMAEIERIRRKLDAVGGYSPPKDESHQPRSD